MPLNAIDLAAEVALAIKSAVGPLAERLAAAEARLSVLGDVRDRVVVMETKAAAPAVASAVVTEPVPPVDLSPVLERIAAAEARLETLGDLRDRVVTLDTKFAQPIPEPAVVDLSPLLASVADLTKEQSALRERIAVAEVRQLVAGPAGQDGTPGRDGKDGTNGKDGADGLGWDDMDEIIEDGGRTVKRRYMKGERVKEFVHTTSVEIYRGVYVEGKSYDRGDGVTWGGSEWHCNETTTTKPGDGSKAWTLKVKRGRDGRDGKDAMTMPVVSLKR